MTQEFFEPAASALITALISVLCIVAPGAAMGTVRRVARSAWSWALVPMALLSSGAFVLAPTDAFTSLGILATSSLIGTAVWSTRSESNRASAVAIALGLVVALMFFLPAATLPIRSAQLFGHAGARLLLVGLEVGFCRALPSFSSTVAHFAISPAVIISPESTRESPLHAARIASLAFQSTFALFVANSAPNRLLELSGETGTAGRSAALFLWMYATHVGFGKGREASALLFGIDPGRGFDAPWKSTSTSEFWTRWNTWYGDFIRTRIAPWFVRRIRASTNVRKASRVVMPISVVAAFLVMGVHHDVVRWLASTAPTPSLLFATRSTIIFGVLGVALVLDLAISRARNRTRKGEALATRVVRASLLWATIAFLLVLFRDWLMP